MKKGDSSFIRDIILGGQDGLVNVLGIVLAVAEATHSRYIILISGLAAAFAESISMAAVAYTSSKAGKEFHVKHRSCDAREFDNPLRDSLIVGLSAVVGSIIPLLPFLFIPVSYAIWLTLVLSTVVLFVVGTVKAKFTGAGVLRSGIELAIIGMTAAIAGYVIGVILGVLPL